MSRKLRSIHLVAVLTLAALAMPLQRLHAQETVADHFAPLDQWKQAVLSSDSAALKALYSIDPPAEVDANKAQGDAASDITFWLGLKPQSLTLEIVRFRQRGDRAS